MLDALGDTVNKRGKVPDLPEFVLTLAVICFVTQDKSHKHLNLQFFILQAT